jgi:hypothetical protein
MNSIGDIVIPDSFDALADADVLSSEKLLGALWSSADPTIDVQTGALLFLLLRPFATLLETAKESFRMGGKQSDLNYLLTAPLEQVSELLDVLAKNYRTSRKTGTASSGKLRLVFSRRVTVSIGPADVFVANGIEFIPIQQWTADSREGFITGELQFYPMPDGSGHVHLDLPVSATRNGFLGNLTRGMDVSSVRGNIPYFVRAFAVETFVGGSDDESNHDLVQRMFLGISAKVLSSRINMQASLLETFPGIRDSSIVGAGDNEMTRDKHTVFPGATGGYVDWYVATAEQLQTATVTLEHFHVIETLPDGFVIYAIDLLEKHFPCLYWVTEIVDAVTNAPCDITGQSKHISEMSTDSPKVFSDEEAMFTAYQLTEVRFTGPANLQTIMVSGTYMPHIKEIQDWVLRCGQSPIGLDVLVKGAVPVTTSFSAVLNIPVGTEVDFSSLQGKVAGYINSIPFDGVLSLSGLIALLHTALPSGSYVSDPALFATQWLSEVAAAFHVRERLILEKLPFGTNRTCILYCDPAEVVFSQKFIEARC